MKIPFFDSRPQNSHLTDEILEKYQKLFAEGDFILGQAVKEFEKAFAQYTGARHAVAVNSGSDAVALSLRALDIQPGDDVLVPAYGGIGSVDVVARLYANPVFVDIDPVTYGMDPMKLQAALTEKTRVIVASHVYGHPCAIDQIHQFAAANNLFVVEDASQALGGAYLNKKLGAFGNTGCYGFDPESNLGAAGDAGMVVTDDDLIAERLSLLRSHGVAENGVCEELGMHSRMDSLQAVLLKRKLEELDESNADRIENARLYEKLLEGAPIKRPRFMDDGSHVYCQYTVEHDQREQLIAFLAEKGIEARTGYPIPHHLQPCFEYLDLPPGSFPTAEAAGARALSLPIYPGLKKREIEEVAATLLEFLSVAA